MRRGGEIWAEDGKDETFLWYKTVQSLWRNLGSFVPRTGPSPDFEQKSLTKDARLLSYFVWLCPLPLKSTFPQQ